MVNKLTTLIFLFLLLATSCAKQSTTRQPYAISSNAEWVQELQQNNPLRDSADICSIYFQYDSVVNNFEVSGIFYPRYYEPNKNDKKYGWFDDGGVTLFFHDITTGKIFTFSTIKGGRVDEDSFTYRSKNVSNMYYSDDFKGFKNNSAYIFTYYDTPNKTTISPLLSEAEFSFFDADFDGENELLIACYHGGAMGKTCYQVFDITEEGLLEKKCDDYFWIDDDSEFDAINKTITSYLSCGACDYGEYVFKFDNSGNPYLYQHISHHID